MLKGRMGDWGVSGYVAGDDVRSGEYPVMLQEMM